jgi:dihydropteroate synthase
MGAVFACRAVGARRKPRDRPATEVAADVLDRLTRPRAPIAGLAMDAPKLMGILNITPDSFSDGGAYVATERAVERAHAMVAEGADLIDVGGESTRPGAAEVPADLEIARIGPVIAALAASGPDVPLSLDTRKAAVAQAGLAAGARIVNDVSGSGSTRIWPTGPQRRARR